MAKKKPARKPRPKPTVPVVWKFKTKTTALGIFVDDARCWIGNGSGQVYALDHEGKVERHFQLPDGVMALVGDDAWMYAGCDDGNVYDLTGEVPRLAYEIAEDNPIDWLDIRDGLLAVSLQNGGVTLIDPESRVLWSHKGNDGCFTVRIDARRVYHADSNKLSAYARVSGKRVWQKKTSSAMFGWQTDSSMYIGTIDYKVVQYAKVAGRKQREFKCDAPILSCATSPDGQLVFGGDSQDHLLCFDAKGERRWKLPTGCGGAMSMQYHDGRLYLVTASGYLACIDLSEPALQAALAGQAAQAREVRAPRKAGVSVSRELETTSDSRGGVVLECVDDHGHLRMHVVTRGYHKDWFVQFPRDVRELGARYVVDEIREATQGGFYRAIGKIRRLVPAATS